MEVIQDPLILRRIEIILVVISGFLLTPELLGTERIKKIHAIVSSLSHRLSNFLSQDRSVDETWDKPLADVFVVIFFNLVLVDIYIFLMILDIVYEIFPYIMAFAIFGYGLLIIDEKLNASNKLLSRIKNPKQYFLMDLLFKVLPYLFLLLVMIFISPFSIIVIIYVLLIAIVLNIVSFFLKKMIKDDFRRSLLIIGVILFVISNIIEWILL